MSHDTASCQTKFVNLNPGKPKPMLTWIQK